MKKVLITGEGSYIGENVGSYLRQRGYEIETIDMQSDSWRERDFSLFDVVFHVAGIAHADVGKVTGEIKAQYYRVNADLAIEVALKAKQAGVSQFIFMSSMIVYGGKQYIDKDTEPMPTNFYGDSKWQADKGVRELEDENFKVVVLRPPMIYGKDSRGNYPTLAKMAKKLPLFPKVNNRRSVLYVGNLCEFIRLMIENEERGVFFPQNAEAVTTSELVKEIANVAGHKIWIAGWIAPIVALGKMMPGKIGGLCNKAFGSSYYDMEMSRYKQEYCLYSLEESIRETEN